MIQLIDIEKSTSALGIIKKNLTLVESSCIRVCSDINCTQKQLRCTLGGQLVWENTGFARIGLFIPDGPISISGTTGRSSDSDCANEGISPWIWQLPPNGPVEVRLKEYNKIYFFIFFSSKGIFLSYSIKLFFQ